MMLINYSKSSIIQYLERLHYEENRFPLMVEWNDLHMHNKRHMMCEECIENNYPYKTVWEGTCVYTVYENGEKVLRYDLSKKN